VKLNKRVPPEVVGVVQQIEDYAKLADTVASHLALKIPDRRAILETTAVTERLAKVLGLIDSARFWYCRSRSASAPASSGRSIRPSASFFSTSR
jgi:ATP-dependent protease La (LON) substrate-binding domain